MRKILLFLFIIAILSLYSLPCTTVAVSKKMSKSGGILILKNRDLSPNSAQIILKKNRKTHKKGELLKLQFTEIPQSPITYGFYGFKSLDNSHRDRAEWRWGCGMGVNEFGVTVCDNDASSWYRHREDGKRKLHDNDVVRLILERCKSAYEGVMLIDKLLKNYYIEIPEIYTIGDKNEVWIVETCCDFYVAKKVKDYEVRANRFEIIYPDIPDNSKKFNSSLKEIIALAKSSNHYREEKGRFSFRKSFGYYNSPVDMHYNDVRVKNAIWILKKVRGKISIRDLMKIAKSHFEDFIYTDPDGKKYVPFSPLKSPHFQKPGIPLKKFPTRTICYKNTVGSMIVEYNKELKKTIMWTLFSKPCLNVYLPIFPTIDIKLPRELTLGDSVFSKDSFWWKCEMPVRIMDKNFKKTFKIRREIIVRKNKLQDKIFRKINKILKSRHFKEKANSIFIHFLKEDEKLLKKYYKKLKEFI